MTSDKIKLKLGKKFTAVTVESFNVSGFFLK